LAKKPAKKPARKRDPWWENPRPLPRSISPTGRPSLYLPEYCESLLESAAKGYTVTAWCGQIGVSRQTANDWANRNPAFSHAMRHAEAVRQAFWEARIVEAGDSKSKTAGPQVSATAFVLKNMHRSPEWGQPKPDAVPTSPGEQHQHIHLHLTPQEAAERYQQLLRED
jgi:hypothetical protein